MLLNYMYCEETSVVHEKSLVEFCYYKSIEYKPFHHIQQQNSQMLVFLPKAACSSPARTTKKTKWKVKIVISDRISNHFLSRNCN